MGEWPQKKNEKEATECVGSLRISEVSRLNLDELELGSLVLRSFFDSFFRGCS